MRQTTLLAASILLAISSAHAAKSVDIGLEVLGQYQTGRFDEGASEIVAHDPASQRLFVVNADAKAIDILDILNPATPTLIASIDVSVALPDSGGVNSVAVHEGLVAVAVEHDDKQSNGWVAFYDVNGNYLSSVPAGALPDMVTFTHNGRFALAANEGEPSDDYSTDPEGSITIIDLSQGVANANAVQAGFSAFNAAVPAGVRISGPGASVAQDLEPEYITTSHDSKTAWVTLQENNALAVVDIPSAQVKALLPLHTKDHNEDGNGLDASNKDDGINIRNWPVHGMYMPDAIASFRAGGETFLITANEGDGREYRYDVGAPEDCVAPHVYDEDEEDCIAYLDEARVKDVDLDGDAFPDGDGDYDALYSFGARSMTIWTADGALVFDSGDDFEQITAAALPESFNSDNDDNDSFDSRSDDKGPEPEGVTVGKVQGRTYAFVGLERIGGIMIYDVTEPANAEFMSYTNNRDFSIPDAEDPAAGDLGPEGIIFINPEDSPNGEPLLVVGNEVSGTTTLFAVRIGKD